MLFIEQALRFLWQRITPPAQMGQEKGPHKSLHPGSEFHQQNSGQQLQEGEQEVLILFQVMEPKMLGSWYDALRLPDVGSPTVTFVPLLACTVPLITATASIPRSKRGFIFQGFDYHLTVCHEFIPSFLFYKIKPKYPRMGSSGRLHQLI